MKIQLSDHFTYKKLLRFTFPSIVMMVFTSIYNVVDGFFVSNFVGKTPFAAINFIFPVIGILGAFGLMFGSGGSALVAKTLGEGDHKHANRYFSLIVYMAIGIGLLLSVLGMFLIRPVAVALGATDAMVEYSVFYARILLVALAPFMLQMAFQVLLITAEKPKLGLFFTAGAGVINMILDYLFIAVLHWGLAGAALASAAGMVFGGVGPLIYFIYPNSSLLRLGKTNFDIRALGQTCLNGSSEMVANIAGSVVSMLYNFQLLRLIGENGVAAYGVIMYVNFIFSGIFFGYVMGGAPIVSYHYGAQNHDELHNLLRKNLTVIGVLGVCLTALALVFSRPLSTLFVGYDAELADLTCYGFRLYVLAFLFMGFNFFGSTFFTALNNGPVSALISFSRMLLFEAGAVLILPAIFGVESIWLAVLAADILALILTAVLLIKFKYRYNYA